MARFRRCLISSDKWNLYARKASAPSRIPAARLDALIEEAIVDAYTEAEQTVGFHATIEQHLALPFETVVLGAPVTAKKVDVTAAGGLVVICYRGRERQAIPISRIAVAESATGRMGVDRGVSSMGAGTLVAGASRQ